MTFAEKLAQSRIAYDLGLRGGLPGEGFTPHACASLALGSFHRMRSLFPARAR